MSETLIPPSVDEIIMETVRSEIRLQKTLNEAGYCCMAALLWSGLSKGKDDKRGSVCEFCARRGARIENGKVVWK